MRNLAWVRVVSAERFDEWMDSNRPFRELLRTLRYMVVDVVCLFSRIDHKPRIPSSRNGEVFLPDPGRW